MADLRAFVNDRVSHHNSLWEMRHFCALKINSIGSSIVITCEDTRLLRYSSIATNDVDFPDPVGPVTKNNPVLRFKIFDLIVVAISSYIRSSNFFA